VLFNFSGHKLLQLSDVLLETRIGVLHNPIKPSNAVTERSTKSTRSIKSMPIRFYA
jgi:hypothetical protein